MTKEYKDCDCENCKSDREFERYMAMKWGTPKGLSSLVISFAIFLISIGVFIWLLHLADLF